MNTILNIRRISLIFFLITGFIHITSSIFLANQMFFKLSFITNKVMEIPFGLTGMIYGLSSIRLSMTNPEKNNKILDISMASIIILTLAAMLIINLAFPTLNQ